MNANEREYLEISTISQQVSHRNSHKIASLDSNTQDSRPLASICG